VPESDAQRRLLQSMSEWLVTLPHDIKLLYEAAANQDLPRATRELAVGAIIFMISADHVPGAQPGDFVNYCDSTILLRLTAKQIGDTGGEDCEAFRERFADFYESLDDDLAQCQAALGELFDWLHSKVAELPKLEHKSKKVPDYVDDEDASAFLYEEGLEFQTEYDVDEDVLSDRLKRWSTIQDALEKRFRAEQRP